MTTKNTIEPKTDEELIENAYFFWGVGTSSPDNLWDVLHAHFEKLAREDGETTFEDSEGVGAEK